jgi:sulfide:quinone oxidoreductase
MARILIVGGGSAGIMTAARLRNALSMDEAEITIVDRSDKHYYQPGYTLIPFGLEEVENLIKPMKDVIPAGCDFIQDEVVSFNFDNNYVETKGGERLEYDYLVLATGAKLVMEEIEGLAENLYKNGIHTFYTLEGAVKLKEALEEFEGGDFVTVQAPIPFKCPGAPIKFTLLADDYFRRKGIRNNVNITITSALPAIFSREPYASKLDAMFRDRNINTKSGFTPSEIDPEEKVVRSWEGDELHYDLLVVVPPNEGESIYEGTGIADATNFVMADKHKLQLEKYPNVFVLGDCANYPTSKTASGARKQAEILVKNLLAVMKGEEPKARYTGHIICPIITRFGKAMFAEFDYEKSISPAQEMWSNWVIKVYMLRPMYWSLMLRGLL